MDFKWKLKILLIMVFFPVFLQAEVYISPSLFLRQQSTSSGSGTTSTTEERLFNFKLGYQFSSGFMFGASIHNEQVNANSNMSAKGVSLGYASKGYYLMFSYMLESTNGNYTEGKGYVLDLGYLFGMGSTFSLGPEIFYRSFEYGKLSGASVTYTTSLLTPAILASLNF